MRAKILPLKIILYFKINDCVSLIFVQIHLIIGNCSHKVTTIFYGPSSGFWKGLNHGSYDEGREQFCTKFFVPKSCAYIYGSILQKDTF